MTRDEFVESTLKTAIAQGYSVAFNRDGYRQIDFGHKNLHEEHLKRLYPAVLASDADISALIEGVAPGRPCAHRPMKGIIRKLKALGQGNNEG